MISCIITDARANQAEEMMIDGALSKEGRRSQGETLICVGTSSLREGEEGGIHLFAFSSAIVR